MLSAEAAELEGERDCSRGVTACDAAPSSRTTLGDLAWHEYRGLRQPNLGIRLHLLSVPYSLNSPPR